MKRSRTYEIRWTIHAEQRAIERGILLEWIDQAIREGHEAETAEIGRRGGLIVEFSRNFYTGDSRNRRMRSVVAICEIINNVCHVLTAYDER